MLGENLNLSFCKRKLKKKNQIWFGFFKYERKIGFYFENIIFFFFFNQISVLKTAEQIFFLRKTDQIL